MRQTSSGAAMALLSVGCVAGTAVSVERAEVQAAPRVPLSFFAESHDAAGIGAFACSWVDPDGDLARGSYVKVVVTKSRVLVEDEVVVEDYEYRGVGGGSAVEQQLGALYEEMLKRAEAQKSHSYACLEGFSGKVLLDVDRAVSLSNLSEILRVLAYAQYDQPWLRVDANREVKLFEESASQSGWRNQDGIPAPGQCPSSISVGLDAEGRLSRAGLEPLAGAQAESTVEVGTLSLADVLARLFHEGASGVLVEPFAGAKVGHLAPVVAEFYSEVGRASVLALGAGPLCVGNVDFPVQRGGPSVWAVPLPLPSVCGECWDE